MLEKDLSKEAVVELIPMTDSMYFNYFKEYENDPDLYMDKNKYKHYKYYEDKVSAYIARQKQKKRIPMAIVYGHEVVGELIFKDYEENEAITIGIAMKNTKYKDKGFGTQAERLAVEYAFSNLNVKVIYADSILSNTRSQHVLEKVGFKETHRDETFVYYEFRR